MILRSAAFGTLARLRALAATVLLSAGLASATLIAPALAAPKPAPTPEEVSMAFSDEEITDGFMRTVFGSEGAPSVADNDQVHKFTGPIRVFVVSTAITDRRAQIERFVRILNRTVANLNIRTVKRKEDANMVVHLVNRSEYTKVIRATLPPDFDTRFLESNHCSAVTGGRRGGVLENAHVFIAASETWRPFRHCMVEEITQALGPVNDDSSLPYSIFNDDSEVPGFGIFDWFILNVLYDRRVKPGMSPEEVKPVLPKAIADARKRLKKLVAAKVIESGSRKPD